METFWLSIIPHKSSEISTVTIHSPPPQKERRKLKITEATLIPKIIQLLSGLSSSLGKFDSRAGLFAIVIHCLQGLG